MILSIRGLATASRVVSAGSKPAKLLEEVPQYKSMYSLDKLYPNSSLSISAKVEPPVSDDGKFSGYIPIEKLNIKYLRSGKPGGQNVNKTDSQAVITFKLADADWISEAVRKRLSELHRNQISKEGDWIIRSQKTRHASLNLADCLDKLRCYITEVEQNIQPPPDPVTIELRRQQYERAAQERLKQKRAKSAYLRMKNQAMSGND